MRVFALLLFVASVACSSSNSSAPPADAGTAGCNANPWECPAGQTCWPTSAITFECRNSGPGKQGDVCQNLVGSPTCGDGLTCLSTDGSGNGECEPDCSTTDPSHKCAGSAVCQQYYLGSTSGPTFSVCTPTQPAGDAGSDAAAKDAPSE